ncbi:MAG: hypothetical protein V2B18_00975 [Pseudomonadota bacterium]
MNPFLAKEDILSLSALKEVFGAFAHEIAQPLNAIMIAAQVLQLRMERSSLPDSEKAFLTERLGLVSNQVLRATRIVDGVRSFGRPDPGLSDTKAVFDRVLGLMGQQFATRGITLMVQRMDSVPVAPEDVNVVQAVMVHALAFARDLVQAVAERHIADSVDYERVVRLELKREAGSTILVARWPDAKLDLMPTDAEPTTGEGWRATEEILSARGGSVENSTCYLKMVIK